MTPPEPRSGDATEDDAPANQDVWEKWWPRLAAVIQMSLGSLVIVYELLSESERPYLLAVALALVSGGPLTLKALQALARTR